jgi:hypothetical protein
VPRVLVVLAVAAGLAAGCTSEQPTLPPSTAAPPQRAELGWEERAPAEGPGFVFRVHRFAVTEGGWEAEVEIENRTSIVWRTGDRLAVEQSFGVMLFATGGLDEVERRMGEGELPGLRPVQKFAPALPERFVPGRTWRATVSAIGPLAAGRHVRIVFGPLIAEGDPPSGLDAGFVWITDHAYRLRS